MNKLEKAQKNLETKDINTVIQNGTLYVVVGSVEMELAVFEIEFNAKEYDERILEEEEEDKENLKKKDDIEKTLINLFTRIPIDIPENFEDIVQFCYEDVCETADKDNWCDGDVAIAFRRWIER